MKLIWSPETASKAYIDTVKSCEKPRESGVPEFLSAMAAGWDAKLIVESWSHGTPIATSLGLAMAARHTGGRHVCIVPDERSRLEYIKATRNAGVMPEVVVGEEATVAVLAGVDFLVVDCKRKDFTRVLRRAKVSPRGAVFACKNASQRNLSGFRWHGVVERGTRVVRSVFLPVGKGLDIAYLGYGGGSASVGSSIKKGPSRWIKHIDQKSGEEHLFRE
ncbi:unnamed protein product [Prunus armeniaca]|uniref:Uncharacterized protein n=1 Tax=Prunus armeniaca TaxID=36596 RepID=A0A6J5U0R4_PRUAR|nr:unnamed protein product [Prunus armeniaca]CAB4300125.1 unnamed protein product [Prunus armeniaca]